MLTIVASSWNALAADGMNLKVVDEQKLIINVEKTESNAILTLYDNKGVVMFKDLFDAKTSYSKILNLNGINDGKYVLVLDKKYSKLTSTIIKKGDEIHLSSEANVFCSKPSFRVDDKKVKLSLSNATESMTTIEVFDSRGATVAKMKSEDIVVKKTFDFINVAPGSYTFKIKTPEDTFIETLEVG